MMCRVAILTFALLASGHAANFLGDRKKVSAGTEESTIDEDVVAETSNADDVDSEGSEEEGAELDGDVSDVTEDSSSDEDQDDDMDMSDQTAEDADEGTTSLLQKPKSTEVPDDETTALAADDSVEGGAAEEDTEESSGETAEDDSDAEVSSEETSHGDPSADESADSLEDPSSAESPVAETFSYDDSSMVQLGEGQNVAEMAARGEKESVDDVSTNADAYEESDVEESLDDDQPNEEPTNHLDDEDIALKDTDSADAMESNDDADSVKDDSDAAGSSDETSHGDPSADDNADSLQDPSSAESPVAETLSSDDSSMGSVNMANVGGLADSEQESVKDDQTQLGEDHDADEAVAREEKKSAEVESNDADVDEESGTEEDKSLDDQPKEELAHDSDAAEVVPLKDADSADVMVSKDNADGTKAQSLKNGTAKHASDDRSVESVGVDSLRKAVLANPEFKSKVQSACKDYPRLPNCEALQTEALFCQLLKRAQPAAAEEFCAHEDIKVSTRNATQNIAKRMSLPGMSTKVQPNSKDFAKELAHKMTQDLKINFNTIIPEGLATPTLGANATHAK